MELHQALKHIIKAEGQDIVTDLRLVNILNDLNAYQDIQGSKYIIRAIIDDGFALRFMQIGALNMNANDLIRRFYTTTGFNEDAVTKIFQSMAFGLGWIQSMHTSAPTSTPKPATNPTPQPNPAPAPPGLAASLMLTSAKLNRKNEDFQLDYIEKAGEYLDSILEFKEDFVKTMGVKINVNAQYSVYANPTSSIIWTVEIHGNIPMKKGDFIKQCFELVVYNHQGRILGTKGVYTYNPIQNFGVLTTEQLDEQCFKCVGNIGKIVIYSKNK